MLDKFVSNGLRKREHVEAWELDIFNPGWQVFSTWSVYKGETEPKWLVLG